MIRRLEPFAYGYFHSKAESKERRIADGISVFNGLVHKRQPFYAFSFARRYSLGVIPTYSRKILLK